MALLTLDVASGEQLLAAKKQFGPAPAKCERNRAEERFETPPSRVLRHDVVVHGRRTMRTTQLRLYRLGTAGNLARLCCDSRHHHELHWHFFEDMEGLEERVEVVDGYPGPHELDSVMFDVFVRRLNIYGLAIERSLV